MISAHRAPPAEPSVPVFPPALARVLRNRFASKRGYLAEVSDEVIVQLLTTVFFAGLETYEGERNPIGVVFLGRSQTDFVIPEGTESGGAFLYQWKVLQFDSPRPFAVRELVKLAVAGVDRRIYSAVRVMDDGSLAITGLAREGVNADSDAFVKIIASNPGCLSIRRGRDLVLGYERGTILTGGEELVFSAGPIRRALEATAAAAGLDGAAVSDYLEAVRSIVRELAAHGRGGILIVSHEEHPQVAESATYRMTLDSSLAVLLRLARRIQWRQDVDPLSRPDNPPFGPAPQCFAHRGRACHRGVRRADGHRRRDLAQPRSRADGIRGDPAGWPSDRCLGGGECRGPAWAPHRFGESRHSPSRRRDLRRAASWERRVRGVRGRPGLVPVSLLPAASGAFVAPGADRRSHLMIWTPLCSDVRPVRR